MVSKKRFFDDNNGVILKRIKIIEKENIKSEGNKEMV